MGQSMKNYLSEKDLTRFLLFLVVVLAMAAGYYQAKLVASETKYLRLEDRYVRVRQELGREETQRLIDESYKEE